MLIFCLHLPKQFFTTTKMSKITIENLTDEQLIDMLYDNGYRWSFVAKRINYYASTFSTARKNVTVNNGSFSKKMRKALEKLIVELNLKIQP